MANFKGYTEAKISGDRVEHTFRAHPWYPGHPWYDWGLVVYQRPGRGGTSETKTYPSRIYRFAKIEGGDEVCAAIRTSLRQITWEKVKKDFIANFDLDVENNNYDFVPLTSIISPLYVFRDVGGSKTKCFVVFPKRCWSEFFDEKIMVADDGAEEDDRVNPEAGNESKDISTDDEEEAPSTQN